MTTPRTSTARAVAIASVVSLVASLLPATAGVAASYCTGAGGDGGRADDGRPIVLGTPGDDVIDCSTSSVALVLDGGAGDDHLTGTRFGDRIFGGLGSDTILGGDGDDHLQVNDDTNDCDVAPGPARDGDNVAHGQGGRDRLWGASGKDHLYGGAGDDHELVGCQGDDMLDGGPGNDAFVSGGGGNDLFVASPGNDGIWGPTAACDESAWYAGHDVVDYGAAPAGLKLDVARGTAAITRWGTDTLRCGIEEVRGTPFADAMTGDGTRNALHGTAGDDTIKGLAADDHLDGGAGRDTLDGGKGTDRCLAGERLTACEQTG